ncbi:MAG: hypothetical protein PWP05_1010, partial [Thermovirga sp.]|nr:hypothetical protein [Thermovirga sp.]
SGLVGESTLIWMNIMNIFHNSNLEQALKSIAFNKK